QITVRGFGPGYNSVSVDGRIMPASTVGVIGGGQGADGAQGNSRAFDFSNIASDGVQAVQVYKTGRADQNSGGIGASINVVTLQPLMKAGQQGSITVKALTNDEPGLGTLLKKKSLTPEFAGSYQWTNDSANFGVAVFASHQEKSGSTRSDTVNSWKVQPYDDGTNNSFLHSGSYDPTKTTITNAPSNPLQLVATPTDSRLTYAENHLERTDAEVAIMWKPSDKITVTANSFYANTKAQEARSELTNWFSQSPYKALTFDGDQTVNTAIVVTDLVPPGKDQGYENQMRAIDSKVTATGVKLKYTPNDNLTLVFDASTGKSETTPGNSDGTSSTTVSVGQEYVASNTTNFGNLQAPIQHVTLDVTKSPTGAQDIASISSGYSHQNFSSQSDKIDQAKAEFEYRVDENSKLSGGLSWYKNTNEEQYAQVEARFGDWSGTNPGDLQKYGGTDVKTFCLSCQFKSVDLDTSNGTAYRFDAVQAWKGLAAYYSNTAGFAPVRPASINAAPLAPYAHGSNHNIVEEQVTAGYLQFAMKGDLLSRPVRILAGARYEKTDVTVTAFQTIPTNIQWQQKNNFSIVQSSAIQPYVQKSSYSNLLPSVDFAMDITDNFIGRMSFSVTNARPQYSSMYATTAVSAPGNPSFLGAITTASSGNPALKPLVSENFDISGEWYYGKNSYISLGYYRKAVQNFIGTGVTNTTLFGLTDPASGKAGTRSGSAVAALNSISEPVNTNTMFVMTALVDRAGGNVATAKTQYQTLTDPAGNHYANFGLFQAAMFASYPVTGNSTDPLQTFALSQPINNHTANIDGLEFAWQHFFSDTGFGLAASFTTVNGDVGLNNAYDPRATTGQFALEGLSNTYNITGIYEKYGFEGRIVYNWRDKYLDQANASQNGGRYVAAYGQWDASLNYQLTPKAMVSFEALNINKAHVVMYVRVPADVIMYQELDSRYELSLRYKF
ncbi:MAG: TonB-dependent receptor, partial [Asticcacaulis sp.]|nr:TonB-dependent receptor [Asticcacaulis sp.]